MTAPFGNLPPHNTDPAAGYEAVARQIVLAGEEACDPALAAIYRNYLLALQFPDALLPGMLTDDFVTHDFLHVEPESGQPGSDTESLIQFCRDVENAMTFDGIDGYFFHPVNDLHAFRGVMDRDEVDMEGIIGCWIYSKHTHDKGPMPYSLRPNIVYAYDPTGFQVIVEVDNVVRIVNGKIAERWSIPLGDHSVAEQLKLNAEHTGILRRRLP